MPLQNKSVLIVEDEFLIADFLRDMLQELGSHNVAIEPTLEGAVDILHRSPPDFVVLDLNLSGKSSLPIAEVLLEKNIRFIFSSGYAANSLPPPWNQHAIIGKPYIYDEFKQKILEVLV